MDIHPIRTERDYLTALKTVERHFDTEPDPTSEAGEHFEVLLALIQVYEARHHPVDPPDPIEAIKFRMEQQGLTPKDLASMIGRPNRVYEVLSRRRPLTLAMIRKLHAQLGIPAESLIGVGVAGRVA